MRSALVFWVPLWLLFPFLFFFFNINGNFFLYSGNSLGIQKAIIYAWYWKQKIIQVFEGLNLWESKNEKRKILGNMCEGDVEIVSADLVRIFWISKYE